MHMAKTTRPLFCTMVLHIPGLCLKVRLMLSRSKLFRRCLDTRRMCNTTSISITMWTTKIPPQLEWKPVVAFIYEPVSSLLVPITVDDGRLNDYAVRSPSGKVHTSSERFFENVEEYREYLCKELAKKRTKAA